MATVIFLISILILESLCDEFETRCLLFNNKCVSHCPRNMHPYHTRCEVDTMSQRTCDEPFVYTLGYTCGWSRCDCNGELLLDERTHSCVDYFTCTHEYKKKLTGRRREGMYKMPKKIRFPEEENEFPI